jgi:transcriptional regulator
MRPAPPILPDRDHSMYVPPIFRAEDPSLIWDLVEDIRLGCLVNTGEALSASHLPFMVDRERGPHGTLVGHMARANSQWERLRDPSEVLVIFTGPNTYISPSWYGTSPRAPTWNFISVQVHGRLRLIDEEEALRSMVLRLSHTMEPPDSPWKPMELDPAYVARLLPGIIGFEIEVTRVEAQLRLSQQNNATDRAQVHAALAAGSLRQRLVAAAMEQYLPDTTAAS